MTALAPAWRRWTLLALLFAIGLLWIAAFALFRAKSVDFLAAEFDATARDRARTPPVSLPVSLSFGKDANGAALLGDGWWYPDEGGTWSWSERATVFVHWPRDVGPIWLTFEGDAFIPDRNGQHVRLYVDDELRGDWFAHRDDTVVRETVRLEPDRARDGIVELSFEVERIASPFRVSGTEDGRHLGFHLRTIELAAQPPAAPTP